MIRTGALVALLLATWTGGARAQGGAPFVETELSPRGSVVVGQPVTLTVRVLTPDFFRSAPRFQEIEIPSAITAPPGRTFNSTERRGAVTFAAQQRPYRITPQVPGQYEIPSIEVSFTYGPQGRSVTLRTAPVTFEAVVPAEARGLGYFIGTPRLRASQSIEPPADTLRVGESVTRTVSVSVTEALSIVIPPLRPDSIDGLSLYADPPRVDDQGGERGETRVGSRVERLTYVARDPGDYTLPAVAIAWWNTVANRLERAELPPIRFTVVPNPDLEPVFETVMDADSAALAADQPGPRRFSFDWIWIALVAGALGVVLSWAARRFIPHLVEWGRAWRAAREQGEPRRFADLMAALKAGDATGSLNALITWSDAMRVEIEGAGQGRRPPLLWLLDGARTPGLAEEIRRLQTQLYGAGATGSAPWSGRDLARAVREERRARRADRGATSMRRASFGLSPLNPGR